MADNYSVAPIPEISVKEEYIKKIAEYLSRYGANVLLVTGKRSFPESPFCEPLLSVLDGKKFRVKMLKIAHEPSPSLIDKSVKESVDFNPEVVLAIGGGSVMDAGKAIAAMIPVQDSVKYYLEDVGTKKHPGKSLPVIAVPTTSGTGSEATKNAVLSEIGKNGFKKSLRHDGFIPKCVVIEPRLTAGCPPHITAFSGMDAFTQLLESYLSAKSNPVTDMFALEGIKNIRNHLSEVIKEPENLEARTGMALSAFYSGISLANAGLGIVHGFAQPLGCFYHIPHGVICGTLMGICNRYTYKKCIDQNNVVALHKYASAGKIFSTKTNASDQYYAEVLMETIDSYTTELKIPKLSEFGVRREHIEKIIVNTGNKYNPVALSSEELTEILETTV